jgi:hypothetical protein
MDVQLYVYDLSKVTSPIPNPFDPEVDNGEIGSSATGMSYLLAFVDVNRV